MYNTRERERKREREREREKEKEREGKREPEVKYKGYHNWEGRVTWVFTPLYTLNLVLFSP